MTQENNSEETNAQSLQMAVMQRCPSFVDDNKTHYVIYVEYINKRPHLVNSVSYIPNAVNGAYWRLYHWDFKLNDNDSKDLIAYNSGSGGCEKDIVAPNFIKNKNVAEIWISDGIELQGKGANFTLINELIELENYFEKSKNPFEIAEIVDNIEYCPKCKSYSRDFCDQHLYYHDDGTVRYKGNHKHVVY